MKPESSFARTSHRGAQGSCSSLGSTGGHEGMQTDRRYLSIISSSTDVGIMMTAPWQDCAAAAQKFQDDRD